MTPFLTPLWPNLPQLDFCPHPQPCAQTLLQGSPGPFVCNSLPLASPTALCPYTCTCMPGPGSNTCIGTGQTLPPWDVNMNPAHPQPCRPALVVPVPILLLALALAYPTPPCPSPFPQAVALTPTHFPVVSQHVASNTGSQQAACMHWPPATTLPRTTTLLPSARPTLLYYHPHCYLGLSLPLPSMTPWFPTPAAAPTL